MKCSSYKKLCVLFFLREYILQEDKKKKMMMMIAIAITQSALLVVVFFSEKFECTSPHHSPPLAHCSLIEIFLQSSLLFFFISFSYYLIIKKLEKKDGFNLIINLIIVYIWRKNLRCNLFIRCRPIIRNIRNFTPKMFSLYTIF